MGQLVGKEAGGQLGRIDFLSFPIFPRLIVALEEAGSWAKNFINIYCVLGTPELLYLHFLTYISQ